MNKATRLASILIVRIDEENPLRSRRRDRKSKANRNGPANINLWIANGPLDDITMTLLAMRAEAVEEQRAKGRVLCREGIFAQRRDRDVRPTSSPLPRFSVAGKGPVNVRRQGPNRSLMPAYVIYLLCGCPLVSIRDKLGRQGLISPHLIRTNLWPPLCSSLVPRPYRLCLAA
jgi:hypothetical protein